MIYEERAHESLRQSCQAHQKVIEYVASPWFKYRAAHNPTVWNYAQPDGLAIAPNDGLVFVVEIKLRHTSESYFQLLDKYIPLMERFFGPMWRFAPLEVCKWYDPFTAFPCKPMMRQQPFDARPNEFSIHRWKDER